MTDFRRATVASFNAMRADLVDLRSHVDEGFARVDENFARVDSGFIEIRGRLDATAAGLAHIADLIKGLGPERDSN